MPSSVRPARLLNPQWQHKFMSSKKLSLIDQLICGFDRALRSVTPGTVPLNRPTPKADSESGAVRDSNGESTDEPGKELSEAEKRHAAGLMRVNHAGEVCAQALYQGQALTAKLANVRSEMEAAADEEIDHLAWCEERLQALHSRPSLLNPFWYGMSFTLGATAGLLGDRVSLGFVAATEEQVARHLQQHLQRLPEHDTASRAIISQMLEDENRHAETARKAGGVTFPKPVKAAMTLVSKVMTETSYRL